MIAAHIPNIMDRSRFGGVEVHFVDHAAEAVNADLVIVDLDRCTNADEFAAPSSGSMAQAARGPGRQRHGEDPQAASRRP